MGTAVRVTIECDCGLVIDRSENFMDPDEAEAKGEKGQKELARWLAPEHNDHSWKLVQVTEVDGNDAVKMRDQCRPLLNEDYSLTDHLHYLAELAREKS
jgi:hypothetical protein